VSGRGLTSVSLPDLQHLVRRIATGQLRAPLSESALLAAGLGHSWTEMHHLSALDTPGLEAALRLVIAEREHRPVPRLHLVWTGPEAKVSAARDTAVVVRDLFTQAQKTVLVGGYAFRDGEDIFRPLFEGMRDRKVDASLFLNIEDAGTGGEPSDVARAAIEQFFTKNWPFGPPRPRVYYDPRTIAANSYVSLHAKCIVVDDRWALVTSANFTDRGQTRNIEAGVLIEDFGFAVALARQWRGLVEEGLVTAFVPS
jgi:phosphatidylserine/phosphatidylglycerophosphate/cardiolipin synthase-like enzyme